MIYGLYSIKDAKTGFMSPLLEQNDAAALRNFSSAVNSRDSVHIFCQYPNDFAFYKIAEFDTDTGIVPLPAPVLIVDASEVLRREK